MTSSAPSGGSQPNHAPARLDDDLRSAYADEEGYLSTGDRALLDSAAATWSRILQQSVFHSWPKDFQAYALSRAGVVFSKRYQARNEDNDLKRALELWQAAVQLAPSDSPDLPGFLNNLSIGLVERFERWGEVADLHEAVRMSRKAVESTPPNSPELPNYLLSLGNGLILDGELLRRKDDLNEGIQAYRRSIEAVPPNSPELAMHLHSLGAGLNTRYEWMGMGDEADLDEAIHLYRRAVEAVPPSSPSLPSYLTSLGVGLHLRFLRDGRVVDLDEAIRLFRQAVEARPSDSHGLPGCLNNLAIGLSDRFSRTRSEADIQEAIRLYRKAVELTPSTSPKLASFLANLGNGLRELFSLTERKVDLEEAIRAYRWAVEATPPDSTSLPAHLNSLGAGLRDRYRLAKQQSDLDDAISLHRKAVEATPVDSPQKPMYLTNFANGLRERFLLTEQEADLKEAIQLYRQACALGGLSDPQAVLDAARNWGRWALERKQWDEVAEAYGYGLTTGRQLLAHQLLREHKESWLRDLQEMSGAAAYALGKLERCEEAVATMERGRGRLLAEALQRHRRDLELLPVRGRADLYQRYREIVNRQEQLTKPEEGRVDQPASLQGQARLDAIVAAGKEFEQVVAEIRQVPGYEDFLTEASFAQVQAAAGKIPLAYLVATSVGGLVLVVNAQTVQPVWLDTLTDGTVREWLWGAADQASNNGWLGAYQSWLNERTSQAQQGWLADIDDITHQLWTHVMQPLSEALHQLKPPGDSSVTPSLTLIPVGLLALLPLHGAWTDDAPAPTGRRYFLDEFTVSYAPSALALGHAREQAANVPVDRLLCVEEPLAAGVQPLPNVHAEVTAIAGLFDNPVILAGEKATREAVRTALPQADVVHFSCHGSNDWQSPLDSGLLMADDETGNRVVLTVRDLLESEQTGGRLATLSACETGIVGTELPDEVVALPSALLQAGYGAVAASLWSVSDISTAMLMEQFYASWREQREDKLTPAQALRAAQRWLRDTTNQEKAEYFKRYSPQLSGVRMPEAAAVDFFTQAMSRDLDRRDFAHPFWWAAFYLTGV